MRIYAVVADLGPHQNTKSPPVNHSDSPANHCESPFWWKTVIWCDLHVVWCGVAVIWCDLHVVWCGRGGVWCVLVWFGAALAKTVIHSDSPVNHCESLVVISCDCAVLGR